MNCRLAEAAELSQIMALIQQAKEFLKKQGVDQWQDGYPEVSDISNDIAAGDGYVLILDETVIGYTCISFAGEPAYQSINGRWLSDQPYAVIHRTAVSSLHRGKGLADFMFRYAETLCRERNINSIKIDTDADNTPMRRLLDKSGYTYCGTVQFKNSDKVAYEKLLPVIFS